MTDTASLPIPRVLAALIGLAGLATVLVQVGVSSASDGSSYALAFAQMMRFFTLWTNLTGALIFASIAVGKMWSGRVLLALGTAYVVVALVYHVLLAATHHPVGLDWWTNISFHTILPAAAIAWWFAFAPRAGWRDVPFVTIAPVIYTLFALIVGRTTAFYPYFFLDQPRLGWPAFFAWLGALALFFLFVAGLLKGVRAQIPRCVSASA